MEIDSNCLFADVSSCGAGAIPCKDLCVRTSDEKMVQHLNGCGSTIEALLLLHGKVDMHPYNLEHNHVCYKHARFPYLSQFKNCCLCKEFGRGKPSNSGLRLITKLYAFAAWKENGVRTSLGKKMCTQCRNYLERSVITEQMRTDYDEHFSWLYDVNFVHTPSISTPNSCHPLSQSVQTFVTEESKERLKDYLQGKFLYLNKS